MSVDQFEAAVEVLVRLRYGTDLEMYFSKTQRKETCVSR